MKGLWKPIETAPRDGTLVDLYCVEGGRLPDCFWGEDWQEPDERCWYQRYSENAANHHAVHEEPTHWKERPGMPGSEVMRLPQNPPEGLLMSMAVRYDHGLGCPGYYDMLGVGEHYKRQQTVLGVMSQLYEEIAGYGYYRGEVMCIEILDIVPGSVVLARGDFDPAAVYELAKRAKCMVLCAPHGETLEAIDDHAMECAGWVRKSATHGFISTSWKLPEPGQEVEVLRDYGGIVMNERHPAHGCRFGIERTRFERGPLGGFLCDIASTGYVTHWRVAERPHEIVVVGEALAGKVMGDI